MTKSMNSLKFCSRIPNFLLSTCYFRKCLITTYAPVSFSLAGDFKVCPLFKRTVFNFICAPFGINRYHKEVENELAHQVLEDIPAYHGSLFRNPLNNEGSSKQLLECKSEVTVFDTFVDVTFQNLKAKKFIEDASFTEMVRSLSYAIPSSTIDEIYQVLTHLYLWPPVRATYLPNFKLLWNTLDKECTKRLKDWNPAQKLLIADCWYHLRLSRISMYNINMIKNLILESEKLTPTQLVHLMFFTILQRSVPQNLISLLESQIAGVLKELSLREISIICLGFFKTQNKMCNPNVVKSILHRFTQEADEIDSISASRLLKFLRKSFYIHIADCYVPLLKQCAVKLQHWDVLGAVNCAMLGTATNIFEPMLLESVIGTMKMHLKQARLKDIEKIVQCLSLFNYMPSSEFLELLFEEMSRSERQEEIYEFPRDFIQLLLFYAYMGHFNYAALSQALNPIFVRDCVKACGEPILSIFSTLDYCIEIECKDYTGPRLDKTLLRTNNMHCDPSNNQAFSMMEKITKMVFLTLKEMRCATEVQLRYTLPHMFVPDIVFRTTGGRNDLVPFHDTVKTEISQSTQSVLKPPADELWGCLVACGPYSFAYKSNRLCGIMTMKHRQLVKLGYKVLLVPYGEVPHNEERRQNYIKRKLASLQSSEPFTDVQNNSFSKVFSN